MAVTWNPQDKDLAIILSNEDLTATGSGSANRGVRATQSKNSGKWFYRVVLDSTAKGISVGIATATHFVWHQVGSSPESWSIINNGKTYHNGQVFAYLSPFTLGSTVDVAVDLDAGQVWFALNGTWGNSGNPATGTNPAFANLPAGASLFPIVSLNPDDQITVNFATPAGIPAGFSAWDESAVISPVLAGEIRYDLVAGAPAQVGGDLVYALYATQTCQHAGNIAYRLFAPTLLLDLSGEITYVLVAPGPAIAVTHDLLYSLPATSLAQRRGEIAYALSIFQPEILPGNLRYLLDATAAQAAYPIGPAYLLILTGGDETPPVPDITIPMETFQARRRSGTPSFLQVSVPTIAQIDDIEARTHGDLVIQAGTLWSDGSIQGLTELVRANYDRADPSEGARTTAVVLSGWKQTTYPGGGARTLSGVSFRTRRGGQRRIRAEVDFRLRPLDVATDPLTGEAINVGEIVYSVSARMATMEIAERED